MTENSDPLTPARRAGVSGSSASGRRPRASASRRIPLLSDHGTAIATGLPMFAWQGAFFVGSLVILVLMSFWSLENFRIVHTYDLTNWLDTLGSSFFWKIYFNTLLYTGLAALLATLIGFPFAYALVFHTPKGFRQVAMLLLIVPFFTSYLIRSYSWTFILADDGLIRYAANALGVGLPRLQGSLMALEVTYLTYSFPLATLLMLLSLSNVDRSLIEAAHNLGSGRVRAVIHVVIPGAKIGIVFAFAFSYMLALGDYIAPSFGGAGRLTALSTLIVDATKAGADFPKAAVIAVIMILTLLVILFAAFAIAFPRRAR